MIPLHTRPLHTHKNKPSPAAALPPSPFPQTHADFHCVPLLYGARTLAQLALPSKCRVVADRLVDVDRAKRVVRLPDGSVLPYDYLVLTPGLQTQHIEQRDGEQRPIKDTHELCVRRFILMRIFSQFVGIVFD